MTRLAPGELDIIVVPGPRNVQLPTCNRQGAVFDRIGHQLVEDHTEPHQLFGRESDKGTSNCDADCRIVGDRGDHGVDDVAQRSARPACLGQYFVHACQTAQPTGKGRGEVVERIRCANRLMRNTLHDGEQVLDAMVELADEQVLPTRGIVAFGNVADEAKKHRFTELASAGD